MSTIFLVEDNLADVELFRMALQNASVVADLIVFEDGRQIIDHISAQDAAEAGPLPDLIMLDLNLPKSDGVEVLQTIRQTPAFAQVPLVVLSSTPSLRERSKLSGLNILEFIVKPAELDEYLGIGDIVKGLLQQRVPGEMA